VPDEADVEKPGAGGLKPVLEGRHRIGRKELDLGPPLGQFLDLRRKTAIQLVPGCAVRRGELHLEFDLVSRDRLRRRRANHGRERKRSR